MTAPATPSKPGQQFAQSVNVLAWFRAHPEGTFMQASAQLGIPVAQLKHELTQLSLCGLPGYFPGSLVEVAMDRTTARVEFTAGMDRPLALTPMEAGVLLFSLEALRSTLPEEQQPAVQKVSGKIRGLLAAARDKQPVENVLDGAEVASGRKDDESTNHSEAPGLRQRMMEAVRERRQLEVRYRSTSSDTTTTRSLNPDHVAMINGETYVWGREAGREQRSYALSRMQILEAGEPGSAEGKPQVPTLDHTDPFNFEASTDWGTLCLSPELAWMLEYYPMWLVGEKEAPLVSIPDTGAWLERFCIAYGENITVMAPESLKNRVSHRAKNGLRAYTK
ncbi:WYL domain-containing protein [Corynebacterium suicordis]